MQENLHHAADEAVGLLRELIARPSHSRSEEATAGLLFDFLAERGAAPERLHNNVWARAEGFDPARPTLLLNSHHDTVRPAGGYTRDPYTPTVEGDRLYGLGSNGAGASVVCLTETFLAWRQRPLPFNLVLALSSEEECMGEHGMRALLPALGRIDMALVGEPTRMQAAVGERGLVVLDCTARGRSGHAARGEGVNALYIALDDIVRLRTLRFERCSELLGPVGIAVTQIEAGTQHNVIPDRCRFVVDVRTTDAYTNEETVELLRRELRSEAVPRSTRVRASALAAEHPLCRAARAAGCTIFVSPTTSDMALMPFPSLKMGPGDSARSHTATSTCGFRSLRPASPATTPSSRRSAARRNTSADPSAGSAPRRRTPHACFTFHPKKRNIPIWQENSGTRASSPTHTSKPTPWATTANSTCGWPATMSRGRWPTSRCSRASDCSPATNWNG